MPSLTVFLVGTVIVLSALLAVALVALLRTRRTLARVCCRYGIVVRRRDLYRDRSRRDGLTGAYNAGAIREMIQNRMNDPVSGGGAFVMLDVDYFKKVNDELGHQKGDLVLKTMVESMRDIVREGDMIGRLGGDEFCIFLPGMIDRGGLSRFCERLIAVVKERLESSDLGRTVTVSVGGVMVSGASEFSEVYNRADKALYEAKGKGRNTCCVTA